MSSSGKNEASQGIKGILGAVLDALSYEEEPGTFNAALAHTPGGGSACVWTLSQYMQSAPQDTARNEWEEIEKSIIANFANDVSIGVRGGKDSNKNILIFKAVAILAMLTKFPSEPQTVVY